MVAVAVADKKAGTSLLHLGVYVLDYLLLEEAFKGSGTLIIPWQDDVKVEPLGQSVACE